MPQTKKPKLTNGDDVNSATNHPRRSARLAGRMIATINGLGTDELANIFEYLGPLDILRLRPVCHKWNEAVKETIVPMTDFRVHNVTSHNVMITMTTVLPNLQRIELGHLFSDYCYSGGSIIHRYHRYANGEDAEDADEARRSDNTNEMVHEIDAISNFTKLRVLKLNNAELNGSYPYLFNFPLLQKLTVDRCYSLKWDLDMLEGFPLLKKLDCKSNPHMTGDIKSLRVLRNTLEEVTIVACRQVGGSFMELADFPRLKLLDLRWGLDSITGDIRDITEHDFLRLEELDLPDKIYGGNGYTITRISEAKVLIATIFALIRQHNRHPSLFKKFIWYLSRSSPDHDMEALEFGGYPFSFCIVRAGPRLGWRWEVVYDYTPDYHFEMNWLDPAPDESSSEYGSYIQALNKIESDMDEYPFFRGYHEPPSVEVYEQLSREYIPSMEEMQMVAGL